MVTASPDACGASSLWDVAPFPAFSAVSLTHCALLQARDQKVAGDVEAAHRFSSKAKCYNILAMVWSLLLPVLLVALAVTGVIHFTKLVQESMNFFNYEIITIEDDKK